MNLSWKDGKYRIFDGMFCEVLRKLRSAYKVKIGINIAFIVESNGFFAHGETIKKAREALIYKSTSRDTSEFEGLVPDSIVSFEKAVNIYRTITGACSFGTQSFVESSGMEKREYSIAEIIEKTEGQYGADKFKVFFGN